MKPRKKYFRNRANAYKKLNMLEEAENDIKMGEMVGDK